MSTETDQAAQPDTEQKPATEPNIFKLELATVADFEQTNLGSLLESIDTLEFYTLDSQLGALSKKALAEGYMGAYRAYRVLMVVCSFHFSVDRQDAFGPRLIEDGMRTPVPRDIAGEQSHVLAAIAGKIDHPLLRARVADVPWYNHRSLHQSASLAIESYCLAIDSYLNDKLSFSYEPPSGLSTKIVDLIERAFQIIAGTGKRKTPPETATTTWRRLYEQAWDLRCSSSFDRLARLGQTFHLIEWEQVAQDAEKAANDANANDYAMAIKAVWELAANAHQQ